MAFYTKALPGSRIRAHYDAGEFPVDTSLPTISGTTRDGETLTAKAESWTGLVPITFAYQWTRCNSAGGECADIGSATEAKYKLSHEDVGRTLRVAVGATNSAGGDGATSAQTATIEALKPSNTSAPTVSGTTEEGQTLTASPGSWEGTPTISYVYQWQDCDSLGEGCVDIAGASSSSYTLQASDVGSTVRVVVTASNAGGSASASSEASTVVTAERLKHLIYTSQFGSEGSGDDQFNHPGDVAIGPSGDLFVLDQGNDRVEVFSESGEYLSQFGSEGSGNGQMSSPNGLAVNPEGDVWVLDTGNGRIEEFSENGVFIRTAGAGLIGSAEGIAVDRYGDVWVSATYEGHLLVFNDEGEYLKTVGSEGSGPGQLDEPEGLTVDGNGHVWVAEWANNRVQEFNEAGEYISGFGSAGSGAGEINSPYGITAGGGHVFVGEAGNNRVQEFGEEGRFVEQIGTQGSGPGQLELGYPVGLAIDSAGDVWITDYGNNRVEEWTPVIVPPPSSFTIPTISGTAQDSQSLRASTGVWTGTPSISYTYQWQSCNIRGEECGNIESATSREYTVSEVDVGKKLRVVVTAVNAAGSASAISSPTATVSPPAPPSNIERATIDGRPEEGQTLTANANSWHGAPPISYSYQWQSCDIRGVECANIEGATEKEYDLDEGDIGTTLRVIVKASNAVGFSTSTSVITSPVTSVERYWAYSQQIGTNEDEHVYLPEQPEDEPAGLAAGPKGTLWVTDRNSNRVEEFNANGELLKQFGGEGAGEGELYDPIGIALDKEGDVWVADSENDRIDEFNNKGRYLKAIVTSEDAGVEEPVWVAIDARGDIWVSGETHADVFSPDGEYLFSVGTEGPGELEFADGLAADGQGHVWIASRFTDQVKEFNEEGQYVREFGSSGTGDGEFSGPYGVAISPGGNIWVGDTGNNRVEEFDPQGEYITQFEGKDGEFRWFDSSMGIAAGEDGDVWVTDTRADQISKLVSGSPNPPSSLAPPTITGFPQEFKTLRAHVGSWNGSPIEYSYEWQICETAEETSCVDAGGSPAIPVYVPASETAGYRVRVIVTATNQGGSTSSASTMSASILGVPEGTACTDYWLGGGVARVWQEPGAWSTGSVPGPEDVACIGAGMSVEIRHYAAQVMAVQGEGNI